MCFFSLVQTEVSLAFYSRAREIHQKQEKQERKSTKTTKAQHKKICFLILPSSFSKCFKKSVILARHKLFNIKNKVCKHSVTKRSFVAVFAKRSFARRDLFNKKAKRDQQTKKPAGLHRKQLKLRFLS